MNSDQIDDSKPVGPVSSKGLNSIQEWGERPFFAPLFLLVLSFLTYGLLIPWLGFYADDWILLWTYQKMGAWGVWNYHITNRPFLGHLYQILMPLLGSQPWRWQLFAVIAPWLTGISAWWLARSLWPNRSRFALYLGLLVTVFPGYLSHGVALTTGHRNIILAIFLLSLTFSILAIRKPRFFWLFFILAFFTSVYNMLAMEYFLFLELVRPFVIWVALSDSGMTWREKFKKTIFHFLPFLVAMLAVLYWRVFLFPYQTFNHSLNLVTLLRSDPIAAIWTYIRQSVKFIWMAMAGAWIQPVTTLFNPSRTQAHNVGYFTALATSGVFTWLALRFIPVKDPDPRQNPSRLAKQILLLSLVPWILGGLPFIIVGLRPGLGGYETRYLLPFMIVSCLWIAFLVLLIFRKYTAQIIVLSALVALSAGLQFSSSFSLRLADARRENFFWNLSYRIPHLKPGTLIIANDFPTGDGSTAWTYILNWLYAPDLKTIDFPHALMLGSQMDNFLNRETNFITIIGAGFNANWDQVVYLYSDGKSCLQIFNPEFPAEFPPLDHRATEWLKFASLDPITFAPEGYQVDPESIGLGSEPLRGRCYYYEIADLARQNHDWEQIRALGDEAIYQKNLAPFSDTELMPFIQAYALGGDWQKALELLERALEYRVSMDGSLDKNMIKDLWEYLDPRTAHSEGKIQFERLIQESLAGK